MKHDLDRLMAERNLDAIIVEGPDGLESANYDYSYFVGQRHLPGLIVKKRGEPTILLHSPWEQIQAEQTGLALLSLMTWNRKEIAEQIPDPLEAAVEYRRQMYAHLGLSGRVGIYGVVKAGSFLALIMALARAMPQIEFVPEFEKDLISRARLTKDPDELEAMRRVGRKTCEVVQAVVDLIAGAQVAGETLTDAAGTPITIGAVKALIDRELHARGMESPSGTIFAQGKDAGLPHAQGEPSEALQLGHAIIFDIFPRELESGFFHDMTRTFAIGYAPPELQRAYDDVSGAFALVMDEMELGGPTKAYQNLVCQYFEDRGHDTIAKTYPIEEGYIHSLGHGLGLEIHEDFGFPSLRDRGEVMMPGAVFTVEPGLYYPERGFGVRIEDTFYAAPDGSFESLTPFPKQLVIPVRH